MAKIRDANAKVAISVTIVQNWRLKETERMQRRTQYEVRNAG
jgi:hypothetical protein